MELISNICLVAVMIAGTIMALCLAGLFAALVVDVWNEL